MSEETTTKTAQAVDLPLPGPANLARAPQADPFSESMWTDARIQLIKDQVCPSGISDGEFMLFLEKCKRSGLDPLMGEAYCVPRWVTVKIPDAKGRKEPDGSPVMYEKKVERFTFQAAEAGMQVRAHRAGDFEGVRFGAIYANDTCAIDFAEGKVIHRVEAGKPRGALIGAWAIAKRKGRDFHPVAHVLFSEYRQKGPMWDGKPETMICKVARALALRLAYPFEFAGVFIAEEVAAGVDGTERDAPHAEQAASSPADAPAGGETKTDDLESFLRQKNPPKAPAAAPSSAPKASAATVNATASKPAAAAPKAESKGADVIPIAKSSPPAAAAPAAAPKASSSSTPAKAPAAPAAGDDEIKIAQTGETVKIAEASVSQLEGAAAFAKEQIAKSPTATWVPRVKTKLEAVERELAARAKALADALAAEDPTTESAEDGASEPPDPFEAGAPESPPEPGSDG
jgi:phage recombination protein Bet